eukprot:403338921
MREGLFEKRQLQYQRDDQIIRSYTPNSCQSQRYLNKSCNSRNDGIDELNQLISSQPHQPNSSQNNHFPFSVSNYQNESEGNQLSVTEDIGSFTDTYVNYLSDKNQHKMIRVEQLESGCLSKTPRRRLINKANCATPSPISESKSQVTTVQSDANYLKIPKLKLHSAQRREIEDGNYCLDISINFVDAHVDMKTEAATIDLHLLSDHSNLSETSHVDIDSEMKDESPESLLNIYQENVGINQNSHIHIDYYNQIFKQGHQDKNENNLTMQLYMINEQQKQEKLIQSLVLQTIQSNIEVVRILPPYQEVQYNHCYNKPLLPPLIENPYTQIEGSSVLDVYQNQQEKNQNKLLNSIMESNICLRNRKTLVLDMDETLIHCSLEPFYGYQEVIHVMQDTYKPISQNSDLIHSQKSLQIYVASRPYLIHFLEQVSSQYEVVVFTASDKSYADVILDKIDPYNKYFSYRLYRDSCLQVSISTKNSSSQQTTLFVKDLSALGRDLSKTIIVDNSIQAFGYQLSNGIPIPSYFGQQWDNELQILNQYQQQNYQENSNNYQESNNYPAIPNQHSQLNYGYMIQ